jgi:glutathione S-transferase
LRRKAEALAFEDSMLVTLYAVPVSNFAATVRLVLTLKGVPFIERLPPDGYASPAYKAIVPTGTVPGLVDGDLVLSESAVIAEYLDERWPEPRLVPTGDPAARARVRWLQRLHDTRIEPPLRALFAHMAPATRDREVVEAQWDRLAVRLEDLARIKGRAPYLAGAEPTLADYSYPATLLLGEMMAAELGRPLPLPLALAGWWDRLRVLPAVDRVLIGYGEAVGAWLESKRAQAGP